MTIKIDYYVSLFSPWTFLGHQRISDLAQKYHADLNIIPVNFSKVFSETGGLPLPKRHPVRQAYRMQELIRWTRELGCDMNLEPKHFPVDQTTAVLMVIAAKEQGLDAVKLAGAFMAGVWMDEMNLADADDCVAIANRAGMDGADLLSKSSNPDYMEQYLTNEKKAVAEGVFGAPSYVINGEIFWGQDRLFFVEKKLKAEA
ncbi:2-hydroxychromene-2-carboxylate isomerase [Sneathiella chinensis]|uniref:2-hydroxychromene-2-carboxylate isomerase n=1 Tax=Sneathiella chinensis TaxID=349750 RepID=A0ABQ5U8E5_9PROT|nr:2-hydroxychromene-2-carboxylate isomerase [Sneathiella chinensis]GLQ08000.1 2-hydroxychromene-2-carboxylate isomerase [Sneathiella chinensis]